jgi:hypothetical protein
VQLIGETTERGHRGKFYSSIRQQGLSKTKKSPWRVSFLAQIQSSQKHNHLLICSIYSSTSFTIIVAKMMITHYSKR